MALLIKYTVTRSADWKSVAIKDNGTAWGVGGEMGTAAVTGIALTIYGTDKTTALYVVTFTPQELTNFLAGIAVTILMSDARWFATSMAPDNFYTSQLSVSGGVTIETQVCFDSYFYIQKVVMDSISATSVPIESFYEANKTITGDLVSVFTLDYLSSTISAARENKWRKVYSFLAWNYNIV